MTVEVIIPYTGDCPHRRQALEWVLARWAALGWRVTVAETPLAEWCKAAAVTPAVEQSDADIIVIADADVWCDGIEAAVTAVEGGVTWAVPHGYVLRLDETSTAEVIAGGDPSTGVYAERPYRGHPGGGMVILPRATYLDIPLDPRFIGWGGEDDSWGIALEVLAGKALRGDAHLFHLWHPPQSRRTRVWGSEENVQLYRRYKQARNPGRMRALLDEMKGAADVGHRR